jgi:TPR repeat protein
VPANESEARHWLELAAEAGDAAAQTELAALALQGIWGPYQRTLFPPPGTTAVAKPNHRLAADLSRRAAHAGLAEAQALLGFILRAVPSLAETPDEADELYRQSSLAGWPMGQLGHAMTLLRETAPEALQEAHELLSSAAQAGLPTAHFLLGAMAESGAAGERDPEAAVKRYRDAAEHGLTSAKTRLGFALLQGRGTERNLVEAETWLRRAAMDGDVTAAAVLGDFHASPERQPPNLEEAARWYRRAAELGHPGCARVLALAISAGAEGKPDPRDIAAWLETAIERGENSAWPELGGLIASTALPSDQLPMLHGWLQRMMRESHPDAGYYVGVCVNSGIGTPADETLARRYYLWAAGEGVTEAMVAAGEMPHPEQRVVGDRVNRSSGCAGPLDAAERPIRISPGICSNAPRNWITPARFTPSA